MSKKVKVPFVEKAVVTSIKGIIALDAKFSETKGSKFDELHALGCGYLDMAKATTQLSPEGWAAIKLAVKESYPAGSDLRRVALLSKAEYTAEKAKLKGVKLEALKAVRDAGTSRVGSTMADWSDALMLREPASVQAKAAKAVKAAKAERAAKKVAKAAKALANAKPLSGKEAAEKLKIAFDTAALIVKGDDDPTGYKPADMLKAINSALTLLGK